MKISPPSVTIGPPRFGVLHLMGSGTGARSWIVPRGTSHFTSPVAVSTASSAPHGGLVQGSSRGETSAGMRNRPYGVPRIWLIVALSGTSGCPDSSASRGMRPVTEGNRVALRITHRRSGSNAALPQFVPPITPGYWMVPSMLEG
jgi:hypothetical protein